MGLNPAKYSREECEAFVTARLPRLESITYHSPNLEEAEATLAFLRRGRAISRVTHSWCDTGVRTIIEFTTPF